MKRDIFITGLLILILAINSTFLAAQEKSNFIGKPAPGFTLNDIEGNEINLSDYKGKVVLVDFWATWCGPCRQSMPYIQSIYDEYSNKGVAVLGINTWERKPESVESFLKSRKIGYTVLLDNKNDVVAKYEVKGIPNFFIIDKKGKVRYTYLGLPQQRDVIKENIEKLLEEK